MFALFNLAQERVSEALGTNVGLELDWPDGVLAARWPWELALSQPANVTALKKQAPRGLAGCPQWGGGGAWQELATGVQDGCRGPSSARAWGLPCTCRGGRGISCYCSDDLTGHPDPTTPNKSCYSHRQTRVLLRCGPWSPNLAGSGGRLLLPGPSLSQLLSKD